MPKTKIIAVCTAFLAGIQLFAEPVTEDMQLAILSNIVPRFLANYQYRHAAFDDQLSSKTFDEYFRTLDPNKAYFTAEDIAGFESYRFMLDDLAAAGNSDFAFKVYDLFRSRVAMYREFAEETLKTPLDFTADESVVIDRRNSGYFANLAELKEFWRKKLKSEVLSNRLLFRIRKHEAESNSSKEKLSDDERRALAEKEELAAVWERTPEDQVLRRLRDVSNTLTQSDRVDILALYLSAVSHCYGPHTDYLAPADDENFDIAMKLSLFGIGATLSVDDGYVKVVEVVPGSPAAREGSLKAGDRIIAVAQDGAEPVDVIDMALDHVVKLVRGAEGTKVTLTVLPGREGRSAAPRLISIVRGKVELKESEAKGKVYEVKDGVGAALKIGVIKLDSFYMDFDAFIDGDKNYKSCTRDVRTILNDFTASGVDAVVMDMRLNGGGSLPEAIALSGLFIESGPIVQVRQADDKPQVENDPDSSISFSGPMAVLTSRFTSSAAEIFSGAMKDYQRALIIGDSRTYGKGTVLQVTKLERVLDAVRLAFPAGSLRYECAVFYRVNGDSTQARGIEPDMVFPSLTDHMEIGEEFSPNYLPWDSIKPAAYRLFDPSLPEKKKTLLEKSSVRLAADAGFLGYRDRIERAGTALQRKEVSLNEEVRFDEYLKNVELEKLSGALDEDMDATVVPDRDDILLAEAMNILADWVDLEKK
ncbi:MAG: carboxy terminal-processing peptidase [Victivallaceae bacterium]|nr:carboxy terminal-processing peptidase [Victivallaceae bacterium]